MDNNELEVFKAALSEEGLDAEVTSHTDPHSMSLRFKIKVQTRDGPMYQNLDISDRELAQSDDKHQLLASYASSIAHSVKNEFTEILEWGENAVQIGGADVYSATCRRCGTDVDMNGLRNKLTPIALAETSMPRSSPPDIRSLSDHKKFMLLLGFLRSECEPGCPNSKYDDDMSRVHRKF